MTTNPDVAAVAALIAVPARAAILIALMDGRALPAGELARCAALSPQAASAHLNKLVAGGFLLMVSIGRHPARHPHGAGGVAASSQNFFAMSKIPAVTTKTPPKAQNPSI